MADTKLTADQLALANHVRNALETEIRTLGNMKRRHAARILANYARSADDQSLVRLGEIILKI